MDHSLESYRLEVIVENCCGVGYVEKIIIRGIFHSIRVIDPRYVVLRRCRKLGI